MMWNPSVNAIWLRAASSCDASVNTAGPSYRGSGCHAAVVVAVDEDAVEDVEAQEEDCQRPPRVVAADREQGSDGSEAGADDPDHPAERVADEQREAAGDLDDPEDDQDPAHRVEVRQDVALVVDEHVGAIERADPVDD